MDDVQVVEAPARDIIVEPNTARDVTVVSVATQGPEGIRGLQGPPGVGVAVVRAAEDVGGNRVVITNADGELEYADKDDTPENLFHIIGMTLQAIVAGAEGEVKIMGQVDEPSWNWDTTKGLFLSNNGLLTQTAPATGVCVPLGFPITPTSIFLQLNERVVLT